MSAWAAAPTDSYVDTGVFISATFAGMPHHGPCARFSSELVAAGSVVYYSPMLPFEAATALRNLAIRDLKRVPEALRQRFRLNEWRLDGAVRGAWLRFGVAGFQDWLEHFESAVPLMWNPAIQRQAERWMAAHDLNSHDALHWATAVGYGIPHFATADREFRDLADGPAVVLLRDDLPYPFELLAPHSRQAA